MDDFTVNQSLGYISCVIKGCFMVLNLVLGDD